MTGVNCYQVREAITNDHTTDAMVPQILIITCESCRDVHYMDAVSEEDVADKYNRFQCKKGCERIYYSYITVGQITLGQNHQQTIDPITITSRVASAGQ